MLPIRWDICLILCASGSISIASACYLLADRIYLFRCIVTTLDQHEFVTGVISTKEPDRFPDYYMGGFDTFYVATRFGRPIGQYDAVGNYIRLEFDRSAMRYNTVDALGTRIHYKLWVRKHTRAAWAAFAIGLSVSVSILLYCYLRRKRPRSRSPVMDVGN